MAIGYYKNLAPEQRLDKIGELLTKGVYLYHQKNADETKNSSEEKEALPILKTKCRENVNLAPAINLDEKIFTTKEAIEFLRISRTTLWRLRKQSKLSYCALGNKLIRFKLNLLSPAIHGGEYLLSEILNYLGNLRV